MRGTRNVIPRAARGKLRPKAGRQGDVIPILELYKSTLDTEIPGNRQMVLICSELIPIQIKMRMRLIFGIYL